MNKSMDVIDPQLIIGAIFLPLLVSYLIYIKNKYINEDHIYVLTSFLLGCIIVIPVLIIELLLDNFNLNNITTYFIQAALVEEGFKFLVLYNFKSKTLNLFDSLKFSILISLGFAMIENIGYAFKGLRIGMGGYETIIIRMLTAIPSHFIFGLCMGYLYHFYLIGKQNHLINKILCLIIPTIIHGFYDYLELPKGLIFLFISTLFLLKPLNLLIDFKKQ